MKKNTRLRFSLLAVMILLALCEALMGWVAKVRRDRIAILAAEFRISEDRVRWAEQMQRNAYASKALLAKEREKREQIRSQLRLHGVTTAKP